DFDAVGCRLATEAVRDLAPIALFDGDRFAGGEAQVERARRGGDIKGYLVSVGEKGNAVGSNLVGRVAVGGDAIGPDQDKVDSAFFHDLGRHAIADQRHI